MASLVAQNTYSNSQMRHVPGQQQQSAQVNLSSQVYSSSSQASLNKQSVTHANGNDSKLSLTPTTTTSSGSSASSPNYLSESVENYSTINNISQSNTSNSICNNSSYLPIVQQQQHQRQQLNQQQYSTNKSENNWSAERKGSFTIWINQAK